jgi:5-methylcytosine-specific restriction endonuclease McrA
MKVCTRCGDPGSFSINRRNKDGLNVHCKRCVSECAKARYRADPTKVAAKSAAWHRANPEKTRAARATWRKAHPERMKASRAASRKKNPQKVRETRAAWEKANPEKMKAKIAKDRLARRGLIGRSPDHFTASDVTACLETTGWRCFYCLGSLLGGYHVDHMTPLSRGGSNGPDNIVCACPSCNLSKGNKTAAEFYQWQ